MTTTETTARSKSYGVNGVPTFSIDGKKTVGGGSRDMAPGVFERFDKDIEKDLESPAEAKLKVDAGINGGTVKVTAAVDGVKSDSKDLKVQILLVEKEIRHLGENGVRFHPMVVRAFGGEKGEGYALEAERQRDIRGCFRYRGNQQGIGQGAGRIRGQGASGREVHVQREAESDRSRRSRGGGVRAGR